MMDSLRLLISTLVLFPSKAICEPNAANAFVYQFLLLRECSILNVENFSSILWASVLYKAKLGSFKEKLSLAWQTTKLELPITLKYLIPISRAVANPIKQASYSMVLFEHGNSNLNGSTTVSSLYDKGPLLCLPCLL